MASEGSLPTLDIAAHVATLTLQRPDVANRLGPDDLQALLQHIETVNGSEVRVLILRSTGKYFCSGFDIGKLAAGQRGAGFEPLVNAMEDCRAVTIAEIQGGVYGGGTDLSLACDFRLGTDAVEMFMPAARLGLHFYERGMRRYVTRLGLNAAKRLFLTELLPADQLRERAAQLAGTIAGLAPIAVQGMKRHLNAIARGDLDTAALAEDIRRATQSEDIREGALAWKEKRKPAFTGK